ncbi:hypothetical protein HRbin36_02515 [bacterium HR36]|nr:hypothetical protein HRbin36_02515 [bacterium HR36]
MLHGLVFERDSARDQLDGNRHTPEPPFITAWVALECFGDHLSNTGGVRRIAGNDGKGREVRDHHTSVLQDLGAHGVRRARSIEMQRLRLAFFLGEKVSRLEKVTVSRPSVFRSCRTNNQLPVARLLPVFAFDG